jgi:type VI secretion system protein ImpL
MIRDDVDGIAANQKASRLQGGLKTIFHMRGKTDSGQANWQERPWFAVVGPPGAGKTTALRNAGLRVDSITDPAISALRSIGGTKFCECWRT